MKRCPLCHLSVAPKDPEKVTKGDITYHGYCWKRKNNKEVLRSGKYLKLLFLFSA